MLCGVFNVCGCLLFGPVCCLSLLCVICCCLLQYVVVSLSLAVYCLMCVVLCLSDVVAGC